MLTYCLFACCSYMRVLVPDTLKTGSPVLQLGLGETVLESMPMPRKSNTAL